MEIHEDQPLVEPGTPPTREIWVTAHHGTAGGGYPPIFVTPLQARLIFKVPWDYTSMVSMILDLMPAANHVCNFSLQGRVGACGEGVNTHFQNVAINQALIANVHNCVDLVPLFNTLIPLLGPGDHFLLRVINNIATGSEVWGMAVRYV